MSINNLLLWVKYRPKTLKQMVLLPRIEAYVANGIDSNLIFYGTPGTGKTTLAKIIAAEYNSLSLNGKLGIDVLSDKIRDHFETLTFGAVSPIKLIFIDEFDRASTQLQDGLKSFIEDYPNARYIFTTNHIDKITPELRSRFECIPFDPINSEEREFMFNRQVSYLRAIAKKEESDIFQNREVFEKIVSKNFPDLRTAVVSLQHVIKTNDITLNDSVLNSDKNILFNFILNGDLNAITNYDYIMGNYFVNFDDAFKYLSRPFFEFLREKHPDILMIKGGEILRKQKEYNESLNTTLDPLIHLINYVIDLKMILKQ